jgi:hypothetical protein
MVDDIVQVPVFEPQFFELLAQCADFFACQLIVDSPDSCLQSSRPRQPTIYR